MVTLGMFLVTAFKRCSVCRKTKPATDFSIRGSGPDTGCLRAECKKCNCASAKRWRLADLERARITKLNSRRRNKEKTVAANVEYTRKREKSDENFRLRRRLRSRIHKALCRVGAVRSLKTASLLG